MKKNAVLLLIVGIPVAVVAFYLLGRHRTGAPQESVGESPASPHSTEAQPTASSEADAMPDSTHPSPTNASNQASWPKRPSTNDVARAHELARAKTVTVRAGQVLATVDGVPITLRDLIAVDPSDKEDHSMSDTSYKYLLERAIARELAFQAARRQGTELSQEQQAQLDQIERSLRGRDGANPDNVVAHLNTSASLNGQIEFEKRDAAGLLLQETLLEKAGGPPLIVTEDQVQRHYQQNISQYGTLPTQPDEREAAWRQIDTQIRRELMYSNIESHQAALTDYIDRLKAAADVQVTDVKSQQP